MQILSNIGLVHRVAQKYKQYCNNTSITYEDLVQEGAIGLITARRKFNPSLGNRFSTYATYWIRAMITRLLDRYYSTMHVTYSASATYNKLIRKYGSPEGIRGSLAQDELIAKLTKERNQNKITSNDYAKFIDILQAKSPLNYTHVSLNAFLDGSSNEVNGNGLEGRQLNHSISKKLQCVDSIEQILSRKSIVERLLGTLKSDEARIIKLYLGFEDGQEHTYKDIAIILGCSKQKAHQHYQNAIKKLRARLKGICLKDGISETEMLSEN